MVFSEDSDIFEDMGIGVFPNIKSLLKEKFPKANFVVGESSTPGFTCKVEIEGNICFSSKGELEKIGKEFDVEIEYFPLSSITFLDKLSKDEIYIRIRDFYKKLLLESPKPNGIISSSHIEKSKDFVSKLPFKPTKAQRKEILGEMEHGILEFARRENIKDEYGIIINAYYKKILR